MSVDVVEVAVERGCPSPPFEDPGLPDSESSSSNCQSEGETLDVPSDRNQTKDSGVDSGSEMLIMPDEETTKKIMETVEFYFSDENVLKDPFLLKHVKRNKEGYVSLKLISSFRKVKSLCRNWKIVAEIIEKSDKLTINKEGTKVRRVTPLPKHDDTPPSRTLIVYNLPAEKLSVDFISDMFSKCGDIALVRILRTGSSLTQEIKKFLSKHPHIRAKGCAMVEFDDFAGSKKALAMDTGKENDMRIVPVLRSNKLEPTKKNSTATDRNVPTSNPDLSNLESPKRRKNKKPHLGSNSSLTDSTNSSFSQKPRRGSGGVVYGPPLSSSSSADNWYNRRHSYQIGGEYATTSFSSLNSRKLQKGSQNRLSMSKQELGSTSDASGAQSPWLRRRDFFRLEQSQSMTPLNPSVAVTRHPRGPDASGGFQARMSPLPPTAE